MKTLSLACALVAAVVVSSGCQSKPNLVGEWTGTMSVQRVTVDMSFTFGSDGAIAVKQTVNGQGSTQNGTYKEDEKSFTMIPTSIEASGVSKNTLDQMNAALAKNAKPITFTLEWKDADTISITQNGAQPPLDIAIVLRRKK